jgi:hypothetical protein
MLSIFPEFRVLFNFMLNAIMLGVTFYHYFFAEYSGYPSTVSPLAERNCTGCRYAEFRGHKVGINVLPDIVSRPCTVETTNLKTRSLRL